MTTQLKTVTVSFSFVMAVDSEYKSEYSTAKHCLDEVWTDMQYLSDVDIEDFKDGDAGFTDRHLPYGYHNGTVANITIGEIKNGR